MKEVISLQLERQTLSQLPANTNTMAMEPCHKIQGEVKIHSILEPIRAWQDNCTRRQRSDVRSQGTPGTIQCNEPWKKLPTAPHRTRTSLGHPKVSHTSYNPSSLSTKLNSPLSGNKVALPTCQSDRETMECPIWNATNSLPRGGEDTRP